MVSFLPILGPNEIIPFPPNHHRKCEWKGSVVKALCKIYYVRLSFILTGLAIVGFSKFLSECQSRSVLLGGSFNSGYFSEILEKNMISLMISTSQDKFILICGRNERRSTRSENRFHGIAPSAGKFTCIWSRVFYQYYSSRTILCYLKHKNGIVLNAKSFKLSRISGLASFHIII